jgi:hypothetical protein
MANNDRTRYDAEKTLFKGPWHVPKGRKQKDANAPKRPMSAFLAFANSRRGAVKQGLPGGSNGDISRALAAMWKEAPEDLRQQYFDEEKGKRELYKTAMSEWKKNDDEQKRMERQKREEMALRVVEDIETTAVGGLHFHDNPSNEPHESLEAWHSQMRGPEANYSTAGIYQYQSPYRDQSSDFAYSSLPMYEATSGQYDNKQFSATEGQQQPLASLLGKYFNLPVTCSSRRLFSILLVAQSGAHPDYAMTMPSPGSSWLNQLSNLHPAAQYPYSATAARTNPYETAIAAASRPNPSNLAPDPYSFGSFTNNPYQTPNADPYSYQYPLGSQYPNLHQSTMGYASNLSRWSYSGDNAEDSTTSSEHRRKGEGRSPPR